MVSAFAGFTYARHQLTIASNQNLNPVQSMDNMPESQTPTPDKTVIEPRPGQPVKKFFLTAKEETKEIKSGLMMPVWTYNGTVPGQEIKVNQGDFVEIELKNQLTEPVTIHWHGYPLKSSMDGVPGVNQDAVRPGETFTYKISADVAGTYWYHSHQEGSKQVDKGLYGAFIVEPADGIKADKDYTLIIDEWAEYPMEEMGTMQGMDMAEGTDAANSAMDMPMPEDSNTAVDPPQVSSEALVMQEEEMMASSYNIYTVNGESGELIKPLDVKKGETVRLRFINAGYRSHGIHIPGQEIKVMSSDGQVINGAGVIKDNVILISPGERYDVEFVVNRDEDFVIDAHDGNKFNDQLKIPVNVVDGNNKVFQETTASYPEFDLTKYGTPGAGKLTLDQVFTVDYQVDLNSKVENGALRYTINGQEFMNLPPLKVKTDDTVKITYKNLSKVNHPMHLHGHFFEVLAKNGVAVSGAPIVKDTLLIKPNEEYTVAFKADNPGNWVQHCHELHHAAAGMMQLVDYTDFVKTYVPDSSGTLNKPE